MTIEKHVFDGKPEFIIRRETEEEEYLLAEMASSNVMVVGSGWLGVDMQRCEQMRFKPKEEETAKESLLHKVVEGELWSGIRVKVWETGSYNPEDGSKRWLNVLYTEEGKDPLNRMIQLP